MKMDAAVDDIRRRFGFYSIQRGLMFQDKVLSAVNAKRTIRCIRMDILISEELNGIT